MADEEHEGDPEPEGDATGGVIPYKNMPALIAYYLGILSILPCFAIGFAAVILGIIGLQKRKQRPQIKGAVHAWIGIILGGICGIFYLAIVVSFIELAS